MTPQYEEPMFTTGLLLTIKQHWRLRGVKPKLWIEQETFLETGGHKTRPVYVIKSEGIPVRGE